MGILLKPFRLLKRLFQFFKKNKKKEVVPTEEKLLPKRAKGFELELESLQKKLSDFLLTNRVQSGKVVERESYKLQKNGPGVYKLEGTESDGRTYSIIIATGNYLREAGGKINGFIHLEEAELNRALQVEHSSLRSFFSEIKNIQVEDYSGILQNNQVMELSWEEILDWERFWKEQLLLLLNPNQVALLLVTLGLTFKRFFYETATDKQKQIVSDELFYLNQGVGEAASPHTRNKGIMNFDSAKRTFLDSYLSIKEKREKEQGTEKPSGNEKKNRLKSALRGI